MIYIRDGIPYRIGSDLASIAKSCLIEVNRADCKKLFILSAYRPPGPLNDYTMIWATCKQRDTYLNLLLKRKVLLLKNLKKSQNRWTQPQVPK